MSRLEKSFRCAIVGRVPLLEDEIFNLLKEEGVAQGSVVSFDENPGNASINIEGAEECRLYLPLSEEYLKDFDAIFLLTDSRPAVDAARKSADGTGAIILDLVGGKDDGSEGGRVPPAEPFMISALLKAVGTGNVKSLFWTLYESAAVEGEKGVRELFNQTASILNFKKPEPEVFKEQVAFNILPRAPGSEGDIESRVRRLAGFSGFISRTVVQVPVFHGTSVSFLLETGAGSEKARQTIISSIANDPAFSILKELSGFYTPDHRSDIQLYIERVGEDRIWGWARFDRFRSHADMAVKRMIFLLKNRIPAGKE